MKFLNFSSIFIIALTLSSMAFAQEKESITLLTTTQNHDQEFSGVAENYRKWALHFVDKAEARIRKENPSDPKGWLYIISKLKPAINSVPIHVISGGAACSRNTITAFVLKRSEPNGSMYFCRNHMMGKSGQVRLVQTIIHEASHLTFPEQATLDDLSAECQATNIEYFLMLMAGQETDNSSAYLSRCKLDMNW